MAFASNHLTYSPADITSIFLSRKQCTLENMRGLVRFEGKTSIEQVVVETSGHLSLIVKKTVWTDRSIWTICYQRNAWILIIKCAWCLLRVRRSSVIIKCPFSRTTCLACYLKAFHNQAFKIIFLFTADRIQKRHLIYFISKIDELMTTGLRLD